MNSIESLVAWTNKALGESHIAPIAKIKLWQVSLSIIKDGGLRGDISKAWLEEGYTIADIPDLYL